MLLSIVVPLTSLAQSIVVSAGYEAVGEGTMSATIGQVSFMTMENDNGSFSQGVQQVFEIATESGIEITEIKLSAYPNPTSDVLKLLIDGDFGNVTYLLYNKISNKMAEGVANATETLIQMSTYKSGVYFLVVVADGKAVKRFKIIKK